MRQIAIYGKGGIGKSTITSNLSAALAYKGNKILQIGCDPKQDSTRTLLGFSLPSVLDITKKQGNSFTSEDIIKTGFSGVDCVESGGPNPGVGCAGRGIILVMDILKKLLVFSQPYDYIFYDVLGDVVCGGFAVPIRYSYAQEVYIVASGEFMSLYAANNIAKAIKHYGENGAVKLGGIIGNYRNVKNEELILQEFSKRLGTQLIYSVPRDNLVQEAESIKKTVIEFAPESNQANNYITLSDKIENNNHFVIPTPFDDTELEEFYFLSVNKGK